LSGRNRFFAVSALLALLGAMLVAAPVVTAQTGAGDQYNPGGTGPTNGTGNGPGEGAGPTANQFQASPAGTGESGGGELPFTGYPLTPLVWIILALIAAGLTFRLVSEARERLGTRASTGS
jgi:hypothetical protein